jgi:hypothetical protein
MNQTWIHEAPDRLAALEQALAEQKTDDVVVSYADVALAFPSLDPHPRAFDYPQIDNIALKAWAASNGWTVQFAHEKAAEGQDHSFPVRFTRMESQ